jgi:hypothetical protein
LGGGGGGGGGVGKTLFTLNQVTDFFTCSDLRG